MVVLSSERRQRTYAVIPYVVIPAKAGTYAPLTLLLACIVTATSRDYREVSRMKGGSCLGCMVGFSHSS